MKKMKFIIKENINKLLPGIILAFVVSFMFFIYEPILMYATNIDDFWFDFNALFNSNIKIFICIFIAVLYFYYIFYLIDKKFFKNNIFINIFTIIFFGLFLISYIQGNILISDLPKLNGSLINWDMYFTQNYLSFLLFILVVFTLIILCYKYSITKVVNNIKYVTLAIFLMLFTSLITTIFTTENVFYNKSYIYSTSNNFNKYSSDENFIIFLVDSVDSVIFKEILDNSEDYDDMFDDFTYYPDTLSTYLYTRDSIPFILSGMWNKNENSYSKYSSNAYSKSMLFKELNEKDFELNFYDDSIVISMDEETVNNLDNLRIRSNKIKTNNFFLEEIKYLAFKYLPFQLKKYSNIEKLNFNSVWKPNENEYQNMYSHLNQHVYNLNKKDFELSKEKQFKFIHVEGAHLPFNSDENLNYLSEGGTYEQKMSATLKIINSYLKKLKKYDVYDNSNIIVMSDHGYNYDIDDKNQESLNYGRQNPILFIKGIDEEHKMYESDLPISFEDLNDAYLDLLDKKESDELFNDIKEDRERKFIYYEFGKENHMIEYIQKGKAWDEDTIEKTGKEFNR